MSVDERARHRLYLKLEEILGQDEAGILMDHLPPTGFANLAAKEDLLVLRSELIGRMDSLESRLTAKIEQSARRLVMWMSTMVLMTGGLAFAAGRFV